MLIIAVISCVPICLNEGSHPEASPGTPLSYYKTKNWWYRRVPFGRIACTWLVPDSEYKYLQMLTDLQANGQGLYKYTAIIGSNPSTFAQRCPKRLWGSNNNNVDGKPPAYMREPARSGFELKGFYVRRSLTWAKKAQRRNKAAQSQIHH